MKKFVLSLMLFSTSTVLRSDLAELRELQKIILTQQKIRANDAALHKSKEDSAVNQTPPVITNSVTTFIITHPWSSIFGAVVFTFVAIKAWDYASKSNKNDENPDFIN